MLRSLALAAALAFSLPAVAADYSYAPYPAGHAHTDHYLPGCDAPHILARIAERFAYADARILHTGLRVDLIDGTHQHGLQTGHGFIDRRYCGGDAHLSDGRRSEVVYVIESRQGFAGYWWSVESCLPAFDPHRVYGKRCRTIRP